MKREKLRKAHSDLVSFLKLLVADESNTDLKEEDLLKNLEWELGRLSLIFKYIEEQIKDEKQPLELLEIGIGLALVTTSLSSCFGKTALNIKAVEHPERTYLSYKNFINHLNRTNVDLKTFDIVCERWPYSDSAFDIVVFSETLEHIPPTQVPFVLEQISRILKNNGILICTSPNMAYWRVRWKVLRGKSPFDAAIPLDWAGGTYAHIRLYTITELISLCDLYNLNKLDYQYAHFGIKYKNGIIALLKKIIYQILPATSPEFILVAVKCSNP